MNSQIEYFQSDRVSTEYAASLDAAEVQGFNDGYSGEKCIGKRHGFFGAALTFYQIGWKRGKSARV